MEPDPLDIGYAKSGGVHIAYHVLGDGPNDLVVVMGAVSNVAYSWRETQIRSFHERLASGARVIRFDRRGTGLSDRPREVPTLEARMDDVRAVMGAVGSDRAALLGMFEAAPMIALFAATYPERVGALVMWNGYARGLWAPDYPWARTADEWNQDLQAVEQSWGTREYADRLIREMAGSVADDEEMQRWFLNSMRFGASPGAALTIRRMAMDVDVREILPAIRVPTLLLHRSHMREHARYMEERIPGAKRTEVPGADTSIFTDHMEDSLEEIERFVQEAWQEAEPETVLSTVLFTDIVGSTEKASEVGDRAWRDLLERHHALIRRQLDRFRGREVDTAGDGFLATFDGPARAIRCACAISESVRNLGLVVRAGLHTGECELVNGKVGGIAVNIGARVASRAQPGEILVSSTVRDLVAGSGISFEERGLEERKAFPASGGSTQSRPARDARSPRGRALRPWPSARGWRRS
jgi:class 3 adenylate cyclase